MAKYYIISEEFHLFVTGYIFIPLYKCGKNNSMLLLAVIKYKGHSWTYMAQWLGARPFF